MPLPIVPAPMTPTVRTCITAPPSPLHRQSYCIAATQAQCRNPTLCVASIHLVEKRDQDAGAAGADRMSESNRAAVHIYFLGIELELLHHCECLDGEGFIQLDQIDIGEIPSDFGDQLTNCFNGRHHYQRRFNA